MKTSSQLLKEALEELVSYQNMVRDIIETGANDPGRSITESEQNEKAILAQIAIEALKEAEL